MRPYLHILALFLFLIPAWAQAALININTADVATLDTLPGIGATKAQAIVDYRTTNGPFVAIADIQNVSGIGASTFAQIEPLITVGAENPPAEQNVPADSAASSTEPVAAESGGSAAAPYAPPPSALSVQVSGTEQNLLEVPAMFSAVAKAKGGAVDSLATMHWSFGDGSSGEGGRITKTYHYPGTYLVVATATDGPVSAQGEIVVTVASSKVRIAQISGEGVTIANESDSRLDLSDWRITSSKGAFRIPVGTMLLPNANVLFPFAIMNVPVAFDAVLAYPNGRMAAEYAPAALGTAPAPAEQLAVATTSYNQIQAVESITSQGAFVPAHEETVIAPTAATDLAAVGAALPEVPPAAGAAPAAKSLFKSPWMLGLGGIIALAAGAFVLL